MPRKQPTHRSPLAQWLWTKGFLKGRFAERIGLSADQIRPAIAGKPCSVAAAHAIVEGTNWEVDYNDLFAPERAKVMRPKSAE